MNKLRYLVQIQFKKGQYDFQVSLWDINEPVKSIVEARSFKSMIDGSVKKARVVDSLTDKVVETWVGF